MSLLPLFDGLRVDKPLHTMSDSEQLENTKYLWENESLGGISENNNPLPRPIVGLLLLTFFTAVAWTFPLFGERPNAAMYEDYVTVMNSEAVQAVLNDESITPAVADEKAMDMIVTALLKRESKYAFQRVQRPITMDDLRMMTPYIIELQNQGADLEEYIIVAGSVMKAPFEGNMKADGTREAKRPWWDKGYTIAIWWFVAFCAAVIIVVKRLPPISWKPDHTIAH